MEEHDPIVGGEGGQMGSEPDNDAGKEEGNR